MGRALLKVKDGKLVKVQLTRKKGKIQKIRITGDFFLHPEEIIDGLEQALVDKPLEVEKLIFNSFPSLVALIEWMFNLFHLCN